MLAQESEERQQGKAEDRGVLALDPVEELGARTFQAVGADARQHGLALKAEVGVEERVREGAHGEARPGDVAPDLVPAAVADDSGLEGVGATAQRLEMGAGIARRGGLAEPVPVADEDLVGADHEGVQVADAGRLEAGEEEGGIRGARTILLGGALHGGLVHAGGTGLEAEAGVLQHGRTRGGLAGQDERRVGRLQHEAGQARCAARRRRSSQASMSCRTVAAVSSMLRRVTSMTGQPRLVQRRRAQSSSALTASMST